MRVDTKRDRTDGSVVIEIHCRDITDEVLRLERYIKNFKSYIPTKEGGDMRNVALDDILYIESVDKKTFIYTDDSVLMADKRLYELEDLLDKRDFFRCSKSVIIHLNKVVQLKPEITRNILATLTNGEIVVVSRRYAGELKHLLGIGK